MEVKEIREIILHRHPFLLADCIKELELGVRAADCKCVTYDGSSFKGRFPQEPVMLGVLLVEALAQTEAVVVLSQEGFRGKVIYLGGIEKIKSKRKVVSGDKIKLECEIIRQRGPVGVGKATVTVDGKLVASAELTFVVGWGIEGECRRLTRS